LISQLRTGGRQLGLNFGDSNTAIQPLLVGEPQLALALSEQLEDRGILVTAIRPPTVPAGTSRLRITLSAGHRSEDVEKLLAALEQCIGS
jgi:8-amino-7-oxononanoate synthase